MMTARVPAMVVAMATIMAASVATIVENSGDSTRDHNTGTSRENIPVQSRDASNINLRVSVHKPNSVHHQLSQSRHRPNSIHPKNGQADKDRTHPNPDFLNYRNSDVPTAAPTPYTGSDYVVDESDLGYDLDSLLPRSPGSGDGSPGEGQNYQSLVNSMKLQMEYAKTSHVRTR